MRAFVCFWEQQARGGETNLLYVDTVTCTAEDERSSHSFCESSSLSKVLVISWSRSGISEYKPGSRSPLGLPSEN